MLECAANQLLVVSPGLRRPVGQARVEQHVARLAQHRYVVAGAGHEGLAPYVWLTPLFARRGSVAKIAEREGGQAERQQLA